MSENSPFMRGVVLEQDTKGWRCRVKFEAEDEVTSFWLSVQASSATGMKKTSMPPVGAQVACLVDWRGEDGVIIGAVYSAQDKPPTSAAENDHTTHADGAVVEHDPVTKVNRTKLPAGGKRLIEVGGTKMLITDSGITVNKPITVGQVPDIPLRGGST